MEGLHLLPDLLQQGDWMVKTDLKDANPLKPSKHSPIHLRGEALQVSMSPIWSLLSTTSFHKTAEVSNGLLKADRFTSNSVSGRYVVHACQQGPNRFNGTSDLQNFRGFGVDGKYKEVLLESNPVSRVSEV